MKINEEEIVLPESRQRTVSELRTAINILKMYMGSGILGLPFAFQQSGLVAGIVVMVILAFISTHCMVLLVKCKHNLIGRGETVVTFGDIAYLTYGKVGIWFVDGMLIFTQFGVCSVYVVYVSQNMATLTDVCWSFRYFALMWLPIFTLLSWIRSLKNVAPLATVANFLIFFGMITILAGSLTSFSDKISAKEPLDLNVWVNWGSLPTMFGMGVYAFEGIGLVVPSETAIRRPEKFRSVLVICLVIASCQYIAFGSLTYLGFGNATEQQVLDNLHDFAIAKGSDAWRIIINIVTACLIVMITMSYPLQLFVATDIIEEKLFSPAALNPRTRTLKTFWLVNLSRTIIVCLTVLVGVFVPNFGLLIGLIGSLGSAALQFIAPAAIYLKLFWPTLKPYEKALYIFYVAFGLIGGLWGTESTAVKIVDTYKDHSTSGSSSSSHCH